MNRQTNNNEIGWAPGSGPTGPRSRQTKINDVGWVIALTILGMILLWLFMV